MTYEICTYGNPVLREKSIKVEQVGEELREMVASMLETMHLDNGVGLAAQQVGHREAVCVVDVPPDVDVDRMGERENPELKMPMVILNPELVERSDKQVTREEGCLSFPGIYANVSRAQCIKVRYMNLDGKMVEVEANGFVARAIQHEMDHLNGVVFVDHISHVKKLALSGRLKRLSKSTKEELGIL